MKKVSAKSSLLEKGRSLQSLEITGFPLADRVGFEPTYPLG